MISILGNVAEKVSQRWSPESSLSDTSNSDDSHSINVDSTPDKTSPTAALSNTSSKNKAQSTKSVDIDGDDSTPKKTLPKVASSNTSSKKKAQTIKSVDVDEDDSTPKKTPPTAKKNTKSECSDSSDSMSALKANLSELHMFLS